MSAYEFVDVVQDAPAASLPAEAMEWNGDFLENTVHGYRTLYVKGREAFETDISYHETVNRDGAFYNRRRFSPRILTIGFQVVAGSPAEFRRAYNDLFTMLYDEQARIIFNDEDDYYFIGTVQNIPEPPAGKNAIVGEIEILCTDPYKHSVAETSTLSETAYAASGYSGFICNSEAYMDLHPRFEVAFENDCGYVAFRNERTGAEIVVGDTEASNASIVEAMSHIFTNKASIPGTYEVNTAQLSKLGANDAKIQAGAYYDNAYYHPTNNRPPATDYKCGIRVRTTTESYKGFYGGSLSYRLEDPIWSAVYTWEHYLVATSSQRGFHVFSIDDVDRNPIVRVAYYKTEYATTMTCDIEISAGSASASKQLQVSTVETNDYTGSGEYAGSIVAPTKFGKGIGQIQYIKIDNYTVRVVVNLGGAVRLDTTLTSETAVPGASGLTFISGRYGTNSFLEQNRLLSWSLESSDDIFYSRPICAGDVIGVDSESGIITVNGEEKQGLGYVRNNFDEMLLSPGVTNIEMRYSDWYEGRPLGICYWRDKKL